jgi:hypothetical protein
MCRKCVMQGGQEEPCVSLDSIRALQAHGELCPRVELREENRAAAELAMAALRVGTDSPLWGRLFDLHTAGIPVEERLALLWRVLGACGDPGVAARVKKAREEPK